MIFLNCPKFWFYGIWPRYWIFNKLTIYQYPGNHNPSIFPIFSYHLKFFPRNWKIEIKNLKSKTQNQKLEIENSKSKTQNQKLEIENSTSKTRNGKLEIANSKSKTQNRKLESILQKKTWWKFSNKIRFLEKMWIFLFC